MDTDILQQLTADLAGRYAMERELGRGGMAVVYLAQDERHQRLVALKVMLPEVVGEDGPERFRREIQIAARLSHPHILPVFDSGEADGLLFYVMPFVDGESLRETIMRERQLGIAEAVGITCQVAEALDYAHAEGVVHRDIKPANIMLARSRTRSGGSGPVARNPLVTDFGIARAMSGDSSARLTATGLMVGTPGYMSPEQWNPDQQVDGRSDQYSLACVLYEALVGEPPFSGPNPMVVLARHSMEMVPSLRIARPTISAALEQAVHRAMAKVPADRFATMGDFADAISNAIDAPIVYGSSPNYPVPHTPGPGAPGSGTPASGTPGSPSGERSLPGGLAYQVEGATPGATAAPAVQSLSGTGVKRRALLVTVTLAAVIGAAAAGWYATRPAAPERTRLMVLPFENRGPVGDSAFADGLTEQIISRLSGVQRLGVVARASSMKYKGTRKSAREIGTELRVSRVVTGLVSWTDANQAKVNVSIVNTADETESPVKEFDGANLDDLYSIASEVAGKLDVEIGNEERSRLEEKPTQVREAYDAFQEGNRFFNRSWDSSDVKASIVKYEEATRADPRFALALAALGRAHGWMYQLALDPTDTRLTFAKQAIDSALRLAPDLPEAHLSLGLYLYWGKRDYEGALREFNTVRRALPSSAEAFNFMGNVGRRKGAWRDAVENYRLAAELDPRSHQTLFNRAEALLYLREFEESAQLASRVVDIAPDFIDGYILQATLHIHRSGDLSAARRTLSDLLARIPASRWRALGHHWRVGLFRIVDDSLASAERRSGVGMFGLDSTTNFIALADNYLRFGQPARARAYYDSAVRDMEATTTRHPDWVAAWGQLGVAYAGLGRADDGVRAALHALQLPRQVDDALDGPEWVMNVARVYALAGNVDKAMEWLDRAMRTPSRLSPRWIELDPVWAGLRGDPRFLRLIREPPPFGPVATPGK